jgi:GNAT superfamily N-acetyltransferase
VDVFAVVRSVLAATLACDETELLADGVRVVLAEERPGRLRFPRRSLFLAAATMGAGAVVSCDASRLAWARRELGHLDRTQLFTAATTARIAARVAEDGQTLFGPDLKLVCAPEELRPVAPPAGVTVDVVDGLAVADLYRHHGFRHALSYLTGSPRPDMLAAVAQRGDRIVGVAGAAADCEELWQIGVDVVEGERGGGIGRAVVGRLTAEVLARGRVPYYSTVVSNLRSTRLALGLGYRLAWTELYARTSSIG